MMGFVRYADRSAVVAFCPTAPYFLAGSAASAIDLNFSTSSALEVFKLDFSSPPPDLTLAGTPITIAERFHSVTWGKTGIDTKQHPLGLVAGGLEDGSVNLWDPNQIVQASDQGRTPVAKLKKHSSAVRALDFNPNLTQFLATGSTEPDLYMWDLTNPSAPLPLTSARLPSVAGGTESDITCTRWNQKVHQILASCTTNGKTIVQDMRRLNPVATLHEVGNTRRCSVLEWSPEKPTQIFVASEDDRTPTVQVWDLRNSASPLTELAGHSKGILSMSWSPHDSRLLLTCSKDSRTYCWNAQTSTIVAELPPLGPWHLHVQWSPISPGLFSVSTFDGKIGICSFTSMHGPSAEGYPVQGPVHVVPKWMERPGGVSFGFGGKLLGVSQKEATRQDPSTGAATRTKKSNLFLRKVSFQAEAVPQSESFNSAIRSGDQSELIGFCESKKAKAAGQEKETWELLCLMFSTDAKKELLGYLGFDHVELPQPVLAAEPYDAPVVAGLEPARQDSIVNAALDFFDNLGEDDAEPATRDSQPKADEPKVKKTEVVVALNEEEVQKALLVRNYEAAVEICLKSGRHADALIIAHVAGTSFFDRVMQKSDP